MSKKRKKRKTGRSENIHDKLKDKVLGLLNRHMHSAYSVKQVTKKLGFRRKDYNREIPVVLSMLAKEGKIHQLSNGSYKSNREPDFLEGRVDHVNPRFAYVIPDDGEEDIYVRSQDLNFAMDGDKVRLAVDQGKRHGMRREGRVLEVIERARENMVGRIEFSTRYAFVIADNRKIHQDIFIPLENTGKAAHDDKVIIEITQWPERNRSPEGKVIRVLGKAGENEAEIHSIMAEFDLPFEFEPGITLAADKIPGKITQKEIERRRDFREVTTFTIDPVDAKDFDDAISFRKLDNGKYEVGVHIAVVTHYVQSDTSLDKEALDRATSV